MSKQKKVTVKAECGDCGGTGIYVNPLCHDGAGMECRRCKGEGFVEISYTPFTARKKRTDVTRVFKANPYTEHYTGKHTFKDGRTVDFSQFGCSYEEWENGATPKPLPKE